jgi:hypothetical protein
MLISETIEFYNHRNIDHIVEQKNQDKDRQVISDRYLNESSCAFEESAVHQPHKHEP